ncbi:MAG: rubrerythrin family protein [Flavobacteriales bacterium CG03_land_8_20_14_0_80_35_15]|nr:rubrerythrin family protein [Zetaproteobacteria bacterium]PIR14031.1 MAG: rubrerythrin family protein [Flavobacteriales bacterium CG11_big_fil_rev_8_21_14_0_20_35_7]PIV16552.1 MAG: rubrerythrin family protein [Flavobacteriales bacterium CG03_land_8_20_14_0_80_35_15]
MEKSLKGTQTEQNLLKSFAGESQARNRYEFFASVAKKEGYEQISAIFMETSNQEKEHAKRFFKFLEGGMTAITASYPAGIIGTTIENLKAAAEGEHEEWADLYPHFAEVAKQEGFNEISVAFRMIARVEAEHERRYLKLLQNLSQDTVFMKAGKVWWKCINCGYVYESVKALEVCPACLHPKAFMQLREENY